MTKEEKALMTAGESSIDIATPWGKNTYSNHLAAELATWLQTMWWIVDESARPLLWWDFRDTSRAPCRRSYSI